MKTFVLFLFFAIISLSEAARPNLRFLRSIPNRTYRKDDEKPIDVTNPMIIAKIIPVVYLKQIHIFFQSHDEEWEQLLFYVQNHNERNLEAAYQYCSSFKDFTYDSCKNYIGYLIEYFKLNGYY